jgi:ABC-type nitrate/sulfonate/bicarbonate transport system substrate-binding protein
MMKRIIRATLALSLFTIAACGADGSTGPSEADPTSPPPPTQLTMVVLAPPSLTSFLPPIIKSQGIDLRHGLDITFEAKSPPAARAEFAADPRLLSATATYLLDVLAVNERGVDVVLLFSTFDYWGTVVVEADSDIQSLADLEGADMVAALATAQYAMLQIITQRSGLEAIAAQSTDTPGLLAAAQSGNFDAVQVWEPAHSVLMASASGRFRALDLVGPLRESTGLDSIPFLGVAVHRSWLSENPDLADAVYEVFREAAEYVIENPSTAAALIAEATSIDVGVLEELLRSPRLGLAVAPASDSLSDYEALSRGALDIGLTDDYVSPGSVIEPVGAAHRRSGG